MKTADYKSIAKKLKFEGRAYINGTYVEAIDGAKFENINPATGETLCSVAKCNHKDVDLAVKVSRKAFESGVWSRSTPLYSSAASDVYKRQFISGKYVDAIDAAKFENINPATGETLCSVAKCNHKDVCLLYTSDAADE